jgi:hypothetical protein
MISRRGFIGLVAGAVGASAVPTLGWFESDAPAPSRLLEEAQPLTMVYFAATAGQRGGAIEISQGPFLLISLSVEPMNKLEWFGRIEVGPGESERLRVEVKGDLTWRAISRDGRSFSWLGKAIVEQC